MYFAESIIFFDLLALQRDGDSLAFTSEPVDQVLILAERCCGR